MISKQPFLLIYYVNVLKIVEVVIILVKCKIRAD